MMHSSTIAGSMPARRIASATTSAPSCGAVKLLSAPRNLPVGVRTAETMTDSRMADGNGLDGVVAEEQLQTGEDRPRRSLDLARPLRAADFDDPRGGLQAGRGRAVESRPDRRLPRKGDLAVRERRVAEQFRQRA